MEKKIIFNFNMELVLTAYRACKKLQYEILAGEWHDIVNDNIHTLISAMENNQYIRIKPETKRVALNQQDLIDRVKENKTLAILDRGNIYNYTTIYDHRVEFSKLGSYSYDELINKFFADGTPCHKEVECE